MALVTTLNPAIRRALITSGSHLPPITTDDPLESTGTRPEEEAHQHTPLLHSVSQLWHRLTA
ncbi:hypothetical protein EDD41_1667 [Luteococcus japonicus]|uniref:Uncharacterized protein n=1 Tax=Luteococcus japonicus TaxID=33984 RepID=A0A3N1ZUP3_9ACTN|nr:hypothetical protein [Luteococcus japonicus]ROR54458.1 hypothetical protein EDD41_1667 [Luteococcus japonicus]